MAGNSFIVVPPNVAEDPLAMRRFLLALIERLDIAFGNRGSDPFATTSALTGVDGKLVRYLTTTLAASTYLAIADATTGYLDVDGTTDLTGIQSYDTNKTFTDDKELIAKKYADDNFTNNTQQTDPTDLSQTINAAYVQAEVQLISDRVDDILALLRLAVII